MADVAKMSDLAITRLCAEAMGAAVFRMGDCLYPDTKVYDPLHDDAQAMALLKQFPIECLNAMCREGSKDFNRTICECVAKMQGAR